MHLELKNISKHYGCLRANDGVDLTVKSGTIHAVLGENGAGKSTLMKILAGYIRATAGEIRIDGRKAEYRSPVEAANLGIGMLYQDPLDFPNLSVLENFMLGQVHGLRYQAKACLDKLNELAGQFDFRLEPHATMVRLTVGERQQLEILRLLSLGIRVLILDEPTTGISSEQKKILFNALKRLGREDKSVLLVSHKLEDVEALCDTATVLRQGKVAGGMQAPFDVRQLSAMMFENLPPRPVRQRRQNGGALLEYFAVSGSGGRTGLKHCTVTIHQGEVVGLAGLEGSGQGVFLRIAAGLTAPSKGVLRLNRVSMAGKGHARFQAAGVGYLPADRLEEGLMPGLSITEHMALKCQSRAFLVHWPKALAAAQDNINTFRVMGTPGARVESLSGGNQQRLLLSFLPPSPKLLLLDNPTRGLDLESAMGIWHHLLAFRDRGAAIVFSSSELDEILMVADRILVFCNGRIIADLPAEQTDSQHLGRAIAGKA